ncbi:MAG: hypothetical protein HC828_04710 [Blastochloris sp.]|nr:hypothetical protein [Blastochloris sp.]
MPYLMVQRLYGDMLIDLRRVHLSERKAQQVLAHVASCAGQVAPTDGAVWMVVQDDDGVLIHGPICFRHDAAQSALIQTGCTSRKARDLLSDRYARWWVRSYHGKRIVC